MQEILNYKMLRIERSINIYLERKLANFAKFRIEKKKKNFTYAQTFIKIEITYYVNFPKRDNTF